MVVADDLGADKVAAFMPSEAIVAATHLPVTPTLDDLATAGLVFTDAWASPVCSATRASLLTGQYAWRTGIGYAYGFPGVPELDPAATTLAEELSAAGWATALFGKWHVGDTGVGGTAVWLPPEDAVCARPETIADLPNPRVHGFDAYAGGLWGEPDDYDRWAYTRAGATDTEVCWNEDEAPDPRMVADAVEWIGARAAEGRDWFAVVSLNLPHTDVARSRSDYEDNDLDPTCASRAALPACLRDGRAENCDFDGDGATAADDAEDATEEQLRVYAAMVECADEQLAALLDGVQAVDGGATLDDTLVVFLGDNGSPDVVMEAPYTSSSVYGKSTAFETGLRVPLLVADGGAWRDATRGVPPTAGVVGAPGRAVDAPVLAVDLYDTLLDLLGVAPTAPTDGESFADCVRDPACAFSPTRPQLTEIFLRDGTATTLGQLGYRVGDDKLRVTYARRGCVSVERYDLATDPYESAPETSGAAWEARMAELAVLRAAGWFDWVPADGAGGLLLCS